MSVCDTTKVVGDREAPGRTISMSNRSAGIYRNRARVVAKGIGELDLTHLIRTYQMRHQEIKNYSLGRLVRETDVGKQDAREHEEREVSGAEQ